MDLGVYTWVPGVVVALLLGALGFYYYRMSRKTKTLDYRIVSNQAILNKTGDLAQSVAVTVGNHELENPRVVSIEYHNTGSEPIEAKDFNRPITLTDYLRVYSYQVDRDDVEVNIDPGDNELARPQSITPDVMNKGEWFRVGYLVDSPKKQILPHYRIVGATRPPRNMDETRRRAMAIATNVALVAAPILLIVMVVSGFYEGFRDVMSVIGAPAAVALSAFIIVTSFRKEK